MIAFDKKLFVYLSFAFIIATIAGTLSHESGHYITAKVLGYEAHIHYASTSWWIESETIPGNLYSDSFYITLGGPVQTILTGTIGLLLLFFTRRSFQKTEKLSFRQWTFIFITLFWLRQIANIVVWLCSYLFTGTLTTQGDEIKLGMHLHIPGWIIISTTAITGIIILFIVIFRFIPKTQRLTFIISGLIGGIAGYVIWIGWLGKIMMP
jgi:hypothetical protein